MMETASEFYNGYVRYNLFWVFLLGLAVSAYVGAKRSKPYDPGRFPDWKKLAYPGTDILSYIGKGLWANLYFSIPVLIWMLGFGMTAMIIDMIFGRS